jgi:hypothetical protein
MHSRPAGLCRTSFAGKPLSSVIDVKYNSSNFHSTSKQTLHKKLYPSWKMYWVVPLKNIDLTLA